METYVSGHGKLVLSNIPSILIKKSPKNGVMKYFKSYMVHVITNIESHIANHTTKTTAKIYITSLLTKLDYLKVNPYDKFIQMHECYQK